MTNKQTHLLCQTTVVKNELSWSVHRILYYTPACIILFALLGGGTDSPNKENLHSKIKYNLFFTVDLQYRHN